MDKWSDSDLEFLKQNYGVISTDEICKHLNRNLNSVKIKANRIGLQKKRKHVPNEHIFDHIDDSNKAYWLGFIAADGYVVINEKGGNYELGMELSIKDIDHLRSFSNFIGDGYEVTTKRKQSFISRGNEKEYESCVLRVYSKHIVDALETHGIIPRKSSYFTSIRNVPDEYMSDFVRGYFDGNGSFYIRNVDTPYNKHHEYVCASIVCGTKECAQFIREVLAKNKIESTITIDQNWCVIYLRQRNAVGAFAEYIYYDKDVTCLKRKRDTYYCAGSIKSLPA